jgi:hypothetical protein
MDLLIAAKAYSGGVNTILWITAATFVIGGSSRWSEVPCSSASSSSSSVSSSARVGSASSVDRASRGQDRPGTSSRFGHNGLTRVGQRGLKVIAAQGAVCWSGPMILNQRNP